MASITHLLFLNILGMGVCLMPFVEMANLEIATDQNPTALAVRCIAMVWVEYVAFSYHHGSHAA